MRGAAAERILGRKAEAPGRRVHAGLAVALLAAALVAAGAGSAAAEIPVPRPKPGAAQMEAAAALAEGKKLLTDRLTSGLTPYAAAEGAEPPVPFDGDGRLELEARLAEGGPVLGEGVVWRVFGEIPDSEGRLPLLHRIEGGAARIELAPGRYVVHAAFGQAGTSRIVRVDRPVRRIPVVLEAGGLQLAATNEDGSPLDDESLVFEIYAPGEFEEDGRRLVAEARPGWILPLPAGPYHVVSRYGDTNAVRSADLIVSPGKVTAVTMEHRAATVSLKLVSERGGDALADTAWTIATADGVELFDYVGAFPRLVLAEGTYVATVQYRDTEFTYTFAVEPAEDREVEVLAATAGN